MAGMLGNFSESVAQLRFLVRLSFDRSPYLAKTLDDSVALFTPLLRRALPHLDVRTLKRRWLFAADLAQHALANALEVHLEAASGAAVPTRSQLEHFQKDLVAFISGGLRAP